MPRAGQKSPAKTWCFTFNNYTEDDISRILETLEKSSSVVPRMYVFQEEVGTTGGTPHLQGHIEFSTKIRPFGPSQPFGWTQKIHWESTRDKAASINYCSDPDKRAPGGRIWSKNMPAPKRVAPPQDLWLDWQENLKQKLQEEPDDRTVFWIWSEQGRTGKTSFCRHMIQNYKDVKYFSCTKSADIVTAADEYTKTYLIDIPRVSSGFCPISALEQMKNGMVSEGKLKKEMVFKFFAPPHIVVFANHQPDITKLSDDRWQIINIDSPQGWVAPPSASLRGLAAA